MIANPYLSVVIPVYNCEECLIELSRRLQETLGSITPEYEIIMVNDASPANDWNVIKHLADSDPRIKGISFTKNFGQHCAITAGLDYANGNWVVVMDGDLQDQPEEIINLHAKALEGFDVVIARRGKRKDKIYKIIISRIFYFVFNLFTDMEYDEQAGNYCILSRKVVLQLRDMRERLRFLGGQVKWLGFSNCSIDVNHGKRYVGKSSYTLRKLWKMGYETIISYSDKPLRISVKFGFFVSAVAFLYGITIVIRYYIYGTSMQGWSSLIVSIFFMGGLIVANIGIIGIYLGKVFDEVKKRPLYVIEEKQNI